MSISKQLSQKETIKQLGEVITMVAQQADSTSETLFKEGIRTEALIKVLMEKGLFTNEEYENKLKETFEEFVSVVAEQERQQQLIEQEQTVEEVAETEETPS